MIAPARVALLVALALAAAACRTDWPPPPPTPPEPAPYGWQGAPDDPLDGVDAPRSPT